MCMCTTHRIYGEKINSNIVTVICGIGHSRYQPDIGLCGSQVWHKKRAQLIQQNMQLPWLCFQWHITWTFLHLLYAWQWFCSKLQGQGTWKKSKTSLSLEKPQHHSKSEDEVEQSSIFYLSHQRRHRPRTEFRSIFETSNQNRAWQNSRTDNNIRMSGLIALLSIGVNL